MMMEEAAAGGGLVLSPMSHASEKCSDAIPDRDEESVREVGEHADANDQEGPHGEDDRTICQWIERMSYRFLGTAFTSFVIRRRFVLTRVLIVFAYWVVGVQYYSQMEHWNPMDSAYFITVTTTTVGYGDLHPTRDTTRLFTIFYAIFGIAFVLSAVSDLINYLLVRKLQTKVLNAIGVVKLESRAWFKLIFSASCILTMIAVGTTFFHLNEKYGDGDEKAGQSWTPITALYWTIITMLTIGYGDLTISESGRAFSLWFIWTCVVIYIMAITNILDTFEELKNDALRKEILRSHRVDILELLENDRRERETLTNDGVGLLGGLHRRDSLSSIYPAKNPSDALTYENSPIDLSKTEIELALTLASKPTMSPLMTHNSLKALFLPATDSSTPADEEAGTNSFSAHQVFLGSRGSIESSSPMRSSSMAEQSTERRGSPFYKHAGGDENPVRLQRPSKRTSIFEDPAALQAKIDRFVLSMLVKMKKVDQVRDIDPLVQHFKAIGMMREEHRDASKETVAKMITDTLSASNTTLSSFAATLVGNKKIVVQKRASEIEKLSKRRESTDPRAEQLQQQQQQQQMKLTSVKRLFPGVGTTNSRSGSMLEEINSAVPGTDATTTSGASRPRGKSASQSITAIKEDEEEEEDE